MAGIFDHHLLVGGAAGRLITLLDQPAQQGAQREGVIETIVIGIDQAKQLGIRQAAAGPGEILVAGGTLTSLVPPKS